VSPEFQIRSFQPDDFSAVCQLDVLCFPPGIAYDPDVIGSFLSLRGAICFVATTEGSVIAWILGQACEKPRRPAAHIITIDVHPNFRRRKVGEALIDKLEEEFRKRNCANVRLEVATDNLGAQSFYARRGYKSIRTLRRYYADGSDALRMERAL